ncbi:MAG: AEC family transporter [Spirochaetes bacterium]|nr:AEC family transporter [Spirochaetota bacterium]
MEFSKVLDIVVICLPVFVMIGIGKLLSLKGIMNDAHQSFIKTIVYQLSLPALIIYNIIQQPITAIFNLKLIGLTVFSIITIAAVLFIFGKIIKLNHTVVIGLILGAFWGNIAYIGFPMSASAFGEKTGLFYATIINTFINPLYVILGVFIITLLIHKNKGDEKVHFMSYFKTALINPLVISAILGIFISLFTDLFFRNKELPQIIIASASVFNGVLKMTGSMGLPLALIAVGGSLKMTHLTSNKLILALATMIKLVIMPLLTFFFFIWFYPEAQYAEKGVTILLMAMPAAVASYVVYKQFIEEDDFMASFLFISTFVSLFTIPVWLYFII